MCWVDGGCVDDVRGGGRRVRRGAIWAIVGWSIQHCGGGVGQELFEGVSGMAQGANEVVPLLPVAVVVGQASDIRGHDVEEDVEIVGGAACVVRRLDVVEL